MLIDFERAVMIKFGPKNNGVHKEGAMQKLSSNKRRKLQGMPIRGIVSPKLLPQQTTRRGEKGDGGKGQTDREKDLIGPATDSPFRRLNIIIMEINWRGDSVHVHIWAWKKKRYCLQN